ncbi:hypothetical protein PMAYCL1PPCAC_09925 [Pristionchus mayeri]|uniref:Uncharacterized protein n=1 Tax=Pristionchus mayeri TaxID=1317129 RepID=A0AAN4ZLB1_9BILA|nr:hypothetical protein PMAYCL1PPCAC_09925 [Pristionchus mayeri]
MRLVLFFTICVLCYAEVEEITKKSDDIMTPIMAIVDGAPDDWEDKDKQAFDQFIANIVKGQLLTIPEEMSKLKGKSRKAYNRLLPVADFFHEGYVKIKNPEARKFFVDNIPAVTSDGVGIGSMIAIPYRFYMLSDAAQDEIFNAFPDVSFPE